MFRKSPADITAGEIEQVIAEAVPEGLEVEFKETLPAKDADPWLDKQERIGDRARNELLAEVIAFANTYGGTLVLGIAETTDKPARASAVVPLPNCIELADRLRLQCRDCIEPQIPLLSVVGVPLAADGSGVVIFSAPKSRAAPHRHTVTRECYVRRADRSEKMSMREIQDLTLQVERGITAIENLFESRRKAFAERMKHFSSSCFGVRVTGIPLVPLAVEKVHDNQSARPDLRGIVGTVGENAYELGVPVLGLDWRPIVRGTSATGERNALAVSLQAGNDGLIEYSILVKQGVEGKSPLFLGWFMGLVANALCAIERFRIAADGVSIEYGLEIEITVACEAVPIGKYGGGYPGDTLGPLANGHTLLPRYSVGDRTKFGDLAKVVERDFLNAAGHDFDTSVEIDFTVPLKNAGIGNA